MNIIRNEPRKTNARALTLRPPESSDGAAVWQLISDCGPLDDNSMYCNLLQCDHFADTCVVAELDGEIVGWVSAYRLPSDPEVLFVWQVAVSEAARGRGVAKKMLLELLARKSCDGVRRLKTTITRDNAASWALFNRIADMMDAPLDSDAHFVRDEHFEGRHATEYMVTIGAFGDRKVAAA
ncbi:diaminobutyrate acetyltransferase [Breoghania sp. L-A4]|uniref:diaminobutyrate acetyltransferase n=1 Tax=Breoghania sp. L-A4 TaxID=2304600 RepID=UPI0020BDA5E4|nr:diaminobutyrate acetyltransferase [Breoghania sp. L-A4]